MCVCGDRVVVRSIGDRDAGPVAPGMTVGPPSSWYGWFMNWLLLAFGTVLLSVIVVDLFATVVKPGGGGFWGKRIADGVYRCGLALHRRRPNHRLLANVGVSAVVSITLSWMFSMWLGWSLVYLSSDRSVLDTATQEPADAWSRVYFAGYSLFTVGLGDKTPGSTPWQIATVLTSLMGLGLVTLAITFLVPVLQAATQRRSFARSVTHLGETPTGIVERSWTGSHRLSAVAFDLAQEVSVLTDKHLSYPILEHLHSAGSCSALAPRVAALYDAVLIAARTANDSEAANLAHLEAAISDFATVLAERRPVNPSNEPPPRPHGLDPASTQRFADASDIRSRLAALVDHDGWDWDVISIEDRQTSA